MKSTSIPHRLHLNYDWRTFHSALCSPRTQLFNCASIAHVSCIYHACIAFDTCINGGLMRNSKFGQTLDCACRYLRALIAHGDAWKINGLLIRPVYDALITNCRNSGIFQTQFMRQVCVTVVLDIIVCQDN